MKKKGLLNPLIVGIVLCLLLGYFLYKSNTFTLSEAEMVIAEHLNSAAN